jgi:hypothetical protein
VNQFVSPAEITFPATRGEIIRDVSATTSEGNNVVDGKKFLSESSAAPTTKSFHPEKVYFCRAIFGVI